MYFFGMSEFVKLKLKCLFLSRLIAWPAFLFMYNKTNLLGRSLRSLRFFRSNKLIKTFFVEIHFSMIWYAKNYQVNENVCFWKSACTFSMEGKKGPFRGVAPYRRTNT